MSWPFHPPPKSAEERDRMNAWDCVFCGSWFSGNDDKPFGEVLHRKTRAPSSLQSGICEKCIDHAGEKQGYYFNQLMYEVVLTERGAKKASQKKEE